MNKEFNVEKTRKNPPTYPQNFINVFCQVSLKDFSGKLLKNGRVKTFLLKNRNFIKSFDLLSH